jgi:hypothetical protein
MRNIAQLGDLIRINQITEQQQIEEFIQDEISMPPEYKEGNLTGQTKAIIKTEALNYLKTCKQDLTTASADRPQHSAIEIVKKKLKLGKVVKVVAKENNNEYEIPMDQGSTQQNKR